MKKIFILLTVFTFNCSYAQDVKSEFGMSGPALKIHSLDSELLIQGHFVTIGRPINGFSYLTADTGRYLQQNENFSTEGSVYKILSGKNGKRYILGQLDKINGQEVPLNFPVLKLDSLGSIDTSFHFDLEYWDKTNSPHRLGSPSINDIILKGDTLFIAGEFSSVNGVPTNGIAAINLTNNQVISWRAEYDHYGSQGIYLLNDELLVSGYFKYLDSIYQPLLAIYDANTLEVKKARASNYKLTGAESYGIYNYIAGYGYAGGSAISGKYGWPAASIALYDDFQSFRPNNLPYIDGEVNEIISDLNGGYYIAGDFKKVNERGIKYLTHVKSNGQVDTAFSVFPNAEVLTLLLSHDTLFVGGKFTTINDKPSKGLGLYDLGGDTLISVPFELKNNFVNDLDWNGSELIVSGNNSLVGSYSSNLHLDLQSGSRIYNPMQGARNINWIKDTIYYLSQTESGYPSGKVATLGFDDGSVDNHVEDIFGTVKEIIHDDSGGYYIAGRQLRDYTGGNDILHILADGSVDNSFNVRFGYYNTINALAKKGDTLFVGGDLTTINSQSITDLALIDLNTGNLISSPITLNGFIYDLAVVDTTLVFNGGFSAVNGDSDYKNLASISLNSLSLTDWKPSPNSSVYAIALSDSFLYVTGYFSTIGSVNKTSLARYTIDSFRLDSWSVNVPSPIYLKDMEVYGNRLLLAGSFYNKTINGSSFNHFASLDITNGSVTDLGFNLGVTDRLNSIDILGDTLVFGGRFLSVKYTSRKNLGAINLLTENLLDWSPNPNNEVYSVSINNDKICLGGEFTKFGEVAAPYYKYVSSDNKFLETTNTNVNLNISAMKVVDDYIYVAGPFKFTEGGITYNTLARLNASDNSLTSWSPAGLPVYEALSILNLEIIGDSLILTAKWPQDSNDNGYSTYQMDLTSGQSINTSHYFDGSVTNCKLINNKLAYYGSFGVADHVESNLVRYNNKTKEVDYNLVLEDSKINDLAPFGKYVFYTNGSNSLFALDTGTLEIAVIAKTYKYNNVINAINVVDTILYVYGNFDKISDKDGVTFERKLDFAIDTNYNITKWNPESNKSFYVTALDSVATINGDINTLADYKTSNELAKYNPSTDTYTAMNIFGGSYPQDLKTFKKGDSLYITNVRFVAPSGNYNKNISIYDLKKDSMMDEILDFGNYGYEINDIIFSNNLMLVGGDIPDINVSGVVSRNFLIYDFNSHSVLGNSPSFDDYVNSIVLKDSIAYVGGEFEKVNGIAQPGIAKFNINTGELIPFVTPYPYNCEVLKLKLLGDLVCLMGYNVNNQTEIGTSRFSMFYHSSEQPYNATPKPSGEVGDVLLLGDRLMTFVYDYIDGQSVEIYDLTTGAPFLFEDSLDIRVGGFHEYKGKLYPYNNGYYPSNGSSGFFGEFDFGYDWMKTRVTSFTPNKMSNEGKIEITIRGNRLVNGTTFYLRNSSDTLFPDNSSYSYSADGLLFSGMFNHTGVANGVYDLLVNVPNDTIILLTNAVTIEERVNGIINTDVIGFAAIRPNKWNSYKISVENKANYDRQNVPIFISLSDNAKLRLNEGLLSNAETVYLDTVSFVETDSLNGKLFSSRTYSFVIPKLGANSTYYISTSLRAESAESVRLYTWSQSPIGLIDLQDSLALRYTSFMGGSDSLCIRKQIDSLNQKTSGSQTLSLAGKRSLINYLDLINTLIDQCNVSKSKHEIIHELLNDTAILGMGDYKSIDANTGLQPFNYVPHHPYNIEVINSKDPNIKIGYKGVSANNYTSSIPKRLLYSIHFENDESATASVQYLEIIDTLDRSVFDFTTVELDEIYIGDYNIQFSRGLTKIDKIFDFINELNIYIRVKANFDSTSGILRWELRALDKNTVTTKDLNPTYGFIPPHKGNNNGQGLVSFSVDRIDEAADIRNKASIIFDNNEAIKTPSWIIIKDTDLPSSSVEGLDATQNKLDFKVTWSGNDSTSGISSYTIYSSTDDQLYLPWVENISSTEAQFAGEKDRQYYFYSVATDSVGNTELAPSDYDARTSIILSIDDVFKDKFKVYPNPSNGQFWVSCEIDGPLNVEVVTSDGKSIQSHKNIRSEKFMLNIPSSGVYLVCITNSEGKKVVSRVVIH